MGIKFKRIIISTATAFLLLTCACIPAYAGIFDDMWGDADSEAAQEEMKNNYWVTLAKNTGVDQDLLTVADSYSSDGDDENGGATYGMTDAQKMVYQAAMNDFREILDPKPIQDASAILTFDSSKNNAYQTLQEFVNALLLITYPLGIGLVIFYFLCSMVETSTRQMMTIEEFFRQFLAFGVAVVLVSNCGALMTWGLGFANSLFTSVSGALSGGGGQNALDDTIAIFRSMARAKALAHSPSFSIQGIANAVIGQLAPIKDVLDIGGDQIVKIFVYLAAYSRAIDLSIRMIFCPIAVANVYNRGMDSPGVRYLKKVVAVELQAVLILAVIQLVTFMKYAGVGADGLPLLSNALSRTALNFAMIGLIGKTGSIANDIVGV